MPDDHGRIRTAGAGSGIQVLHNRPADGREKRREILHEDRPQWAVLQFRDSASAVRSASVPVTTAIPAGEGPIMRALGRFVIVLAGATTALLAIGTAVFAAGSSNEVLGATETVNGVRYSSAWVDFSGSQNNEATLADLAPDGHHAHMDLYFYDPRLETTVTLKLDNYNGYNSYNVVKTYGSTIPPGATVHFRACAQEGSSPVILCSSYVTAVAG